MIKKLKLWYLNSEEKNSIETRRFINTENSSRTILIQCLYDNEFFAEYSKILKTNNSYKVIGFFPVVYYYSFTEAILIIPAILKKIHHLIQRVKWKKIYSSIGVNDFQSPLEIPISVKFQNLLKAILFFNKLKTKEQLIKHKFEGILCGDLIYDTYLRFSKKATLKVRDFDLIIYLSTCYDQIWISKKISKSYKFLKYLGTYSTYINSGIIIRVFLENQISTYLINKSYPGEVFYKKLSQNDWRHVKDHSNFSNEFKTLNSNSLAIKGYKSFGERFKGNNDLKYMKINQYSSKQDEELFSLDFEGVVFLHDFFDSPHIYKSFIFTDFYEWVLFTINLVLKNNLNIAFKPHPNQLPESREIVEKLKKEFPLIHWLDEKLSNSTIFKSNLKFGISVHGTVLAELAYHNLIPIACGDNPTSSFNFVFEAKSLEEYISFISNYKDLILPKDIKKQIGIYYYMNYIHIKNDFNLILHEI